jgi:FAD/FMN-containing dehydrogenase
VDPDVWTKLRAVEPTPHEAVVFRLSRLPSEIGTAWAEASAVAAACEGTLVHASPARGIVRCIVPRNDDDLAWLERAFEAPSTSTRIGERMPDSLWPACAPSPIADPLSSRIKATFDPMGVLNPGIFGELS